MHRETLQARAERGEAIDFLFFWGHTPKGGEKVGPFCFSQWWPLRFEVDGEAYAAAEHFMMAEKARLFGDEEVRRRILSTADPAEAKKLGREVRGFDEARWAEARYGIVVAGNLAKFGQHEDLRRYLLSTGDKVLVEASPRDTIWGIGLGAENPQARDPRQWRGLNLLGFALMEVRGRLSAG